MTERDEVLHRLRAATRSELTAISKALGVELGEDQDTNVVHLADAFRSAASEKVYRTTLINVAREVAGQAKWKPETIPDTAEALWVEDYVYLALGFVHRPDRGSLSEHEKAKERERAERALQGQLPPPQKQSDAAFAELAGAAGAVAAGLVFGLYFFVPLAAVAAIAILFGPSMKKVVPATLLLIHVRKRQEFEKVLSTAGAAT